MSKWLVALVALLSFLGGTVVAHLSLLDGVDGVMWSLLFEDDTVFASGYTDRGFRAVQVGMEPEVVEQLLGKPLEEYPVPGTGEFGWRYARSAHGSHYRIRAVLFGKDRRVVKRFSGFYVD